MTEETVASAADVSIGRLAKIYIRIRTARAEKQKELDDMEEQQKEVGLAMKDILVAEGCKSMKTDFGTVSLGKSTRYYTNDWANYDAWIIENKLEPSSMFEKRIAQKNMAEFLEEHPGIVPPGLNSETEFTVSVRKPTK
jgi:hypothetical protein